MTSTRILRCILVVRRSLPQTLDLKNDNDHVHNIIIIILLYLLIIIMYREL